MLDLNKMQSKILGVFVNNYQDYEGEFKRGFTGNSLEKYGIPAKSFRTYKKYLEDNYLIRLNFIGYHGLARLATEKKSQKRQYWYYYKVTKLGLITYLKWRNENKLPSKITLTKDSFPLLVPHMKKIYKKYGIITNRVLQNTTDQIKIIPRVELKSEKSNRYSKRLSETLTLPMYDITVQVYREILPPQKIPINNLKQNVGKTDNFSDKINNEIDKSIEERFTFLYLYNLMNLGYDFNEMINVLTLYSKPKTITQLEKELPKHLTKMSDNVPFILKLIKSDKNLEVIFKNMTKEISQKLHDSKTFDILRSNFSS